MFIRRLITPFLLGLMLIGMVLQAWAAPAAPYADVEVDWNAVTSTSITSYGTNIWWSDQDADLWVERINGLSPSIVRLSLSQPVVELTNDDSDPQHINWEGFLFDSPQPIPNTTDRTLTLSVLLTALRDTNLEVMVHFAYLSPWLSANGDQTYPPNDMAEYTEFISATLTYIVDTLGFPPERLLIEAVNEPDLDCGVDPDALCFWNNWQMSDLVEVISVTHEVIEAIDPAIRLVGLSECCSTDLVRDLLDHYPQGAYLDALSFHYYSVGNNLDEAITRGNTLSSYGLPIYYDEYGSRQYRSEGIEGGLWHSWALPVIVRADLLPLQYPIAESPYVLGIYNDMGLFSDWREGWTIKPSYWVYANFFAHLGGTQILSSTAPADLDVLAARRGSGDSAEIILWITNLQNTTYTNLTFKISGLPLSGARLYLYDNLAGLDPIENRPIAGGPLNFSVTIPALSSRTLRLNAQNAPTPSNWMFLPNVIKESGK